LKQIVKIMEKMVKMVKIIEKMVKMVKIIEKMVKNNQSPQRQHAEPLLHTKPPATH
jgi:hypothetical protein